MSTGDHTISRRSLSALGLGGLAAAGAVLTPAPAQAQGPQGNGNPPWAQAAGAASVTSVEDLRAEAGEAGDQVSLLGYHGDTPGRGGGLLYWDPASEEADDGGTVFAVEGHGPGRWKRPVGTEIDLAWFGWRGTGEEDDSGRLQAAADALPVGGVIAVGPGKVRLQQTVGLGRAPVTIAGSGHTRDTEVGTQILVDTGDADGFVLTGMNGGGFRDLQVQGVELTGGSLIRTESAGTEKDDGNYMVAFTNVRFRDGYNGTTLRACNSVRFQNCVWNGFSGEQVILLNGVDDGNRADPIEFVQCGIAAGPDNDGTDNVVVDGLGGSLKFFATAILFGRHGLWMRNTTGSDALPKFVYFEGGGFENGHGVSVLLEKGAQAQFANTYISTDGMLDNVRIGPDFTGGATFSGCVVRGAGRNGIDIASARTTVTGCLIGNNGRSAHTAFAKAIADVADDGSGGVRVTTAEAHGWETGDRVTIGGVTGAEGANGKWDIEVVDDTAFDLGGAVLDADYSGVGEAYRHGAGVNIRAGATRVVMTGSAVGAFVGDGVSRQDYAVVNAAADVLITANDFNGNRDGGVRSTAVPSADTRITANKGTGDVDGWFTASIEGEVADGAYDFGDTLFVDGQKLMVVRATHALGGGSCGVRFGVDGGSATGTVAVGTEVGSQVYAQPALVDGTGGPRRVGVLVDDASADATGLTVQFGYRFVG